MAEEDAGRSFFDITQYSEKTRKIIFGVVVAVLIAVMGAAMFLLSPKNDTVVAETDSTPSPTATQAAVDDETASSPSVREEAVTPMEDLPLQPSDETAYPKDEQEEAAAAQQKIIQESLKREKEQTDKVVEDTHDYIEGAEELKTIASKGMIEYCTDNPNETKEEKQARLKPYFHEDNADYRSPQSIFFMQKCSLGGITEPFHDEKNNVVVLVGVAWGAQFEENGNASTGYTQYRVIVDKSGIVSFDD
jgi:hypothetical protein